MLLLLLCLASDAHSSTCLSLLVDKPLTEKGVATSVSCPQCGSPMIFRESQKPGARVKFFYACSNNQYNAATKSYTGCRGFLPADRDGSPIRSSDLPQLDAATTRSNWEKKKAKLDDQQQVAYQQIVFGTGNVQVPAGAGSGKTSTTVTAYAGLIYERKLPPQSIILTTFTAAAAQQLNKDVNELVPPEVMPNVRISTFDSLAAKACNQAGKMPTGTNISTLKASGKQDWQRQEKQGEDLLPMAAWFRAICNAKQLPDRPLGLGVLEEAFWYTAQQWDGGMTDQVVQLLGRYKKYGYSDEDAKIWRDIVKELSPREYSTAIGVCRSRGVDVLATPKEAKQLCEELYPGLPLLYDVWQMYQEGKRKKNAYDFGDVMQVWYDGMKTGTIRTRAQVVIVDEAQDNSFVQLELVRMMAEGGRLVLVGDSRQAIYSWRGGFPDIFINAPTLLKAVQTPIMGNYRSGYEIVRVANTLCRDADGQFRSWAVGGDAIAKRDGGKFSGDIAVRGFKDDTTMAISLTEEIQKAVQNGAKYSDIAMLSRTNAALVAMQLALISANIPTQLVGAETAIFSSQHMLAFIGLIKTAMNWPVLNKESDAIEKFFKREESSPLTQVYGLGHSTEKLVEVLTRVFGAAFERENKIRAKRDALLKQKNKVVAAEDIEAQPEIDAVLTAVKTVGAKAFLDLVEKSQDSEGEDAIGQGGRGYKKQREAVNVELNAVVLTSCHKAKGLQWKIVYVPATAGEFPSKRSAERPAGLEEERRLFYVALTRAADTLHVCYKQAAGKGKGGPSSFIGDAGLMSLSLQEDARFGSERDTVETDDSLFGSATTETIQTKLVDTTPVEDVSGYGPRFPGRMQNMPELLIKNLSFLGSYEGAITKWGWGNTAAETEGWAVRHPAWRNVYWNLTQADVLEALRYVAVKQGLTPQAQPGLKGKARGVPAVDVALFENYSTPAQWVRILIQPAVGIIPPRLTVYRIDEAGKTPPKQEATVWPRIPNDSDEESWVDHLKIAIQSVV